MVILRAHPGSVVQEDIHYDTSDIPSRLCDPEDKSEIHRLANSQCGATTFMEIPCIPLFIRDC